MNYEANTGGTIPSTCSYAKADGIKNSDFITGDQSNPINIRIDGRLY